MEAQMKHPKTLIEFMQPYPTEEDCRQAIFEHRWLPWSHIVLSNFKRWTRDIFHGVSPAHLQAYFDEYCYRLKRRGPREDIFRRLLNRCLLYTGPAPYSLLTAT
jgi:ISXO2-like transposase domain